MTPGEILARAEMLQQASEQLRDLAGESLRAERWRESEMMALSGCMVAVARNATATARQGEEAHEALRPAPKPVETRGPAEVVQISGFRRRG